MSHKSLILDLHRINAIKFGAFTLKSGVESPIYLDLRVIVSHPKLLAKVADAMWEKVQGIPFEYVCGVPYTALPIATALSLSRTIPMVMRRKEQKNYGTKQTIEGSFSPGASCLVVEDLVTSGSSVLETVDPLRAHGMKVDNAVVLIDREQGGRENLEKEKISLHPVFTLREMLSTLRAEEKITAAQESQVLKFLRSNQRAAHAPVP